MFRRLSSLAALLWLCACGEVAAPGPDRGAPPALPPVLIDYGAKAMPHLLKLSEQPRPVGSAGEAAALDYLEQQFRALGLEPRREDFLVLGPTLRSVNLVVDLPGAGEDWLLLGAHYDSTAEQAGSLGASDNASSLAALLVLTGALQAQPLPYRVRLVLFGAEEIGLQGSNAYVRQLRRNASGELARLRGMINLDTIGGGDLLYAHSATTAPYSCTGTPGGDYSGDPSLREALLAASRQRLGNAGLQKHADTADYPAGETGAWSDHVAFACAGVPVAYVEATHFGIHGQSGQDGYSQTVHPAYWTCFDSAASAPCDREQEQLWGEIWHTGFDRPEVIERDFPDRMRQQLDVVIHSLHELLLNADRYLADAQLAGSPTPAKADPVAAVRQHRH